MLFIEQGTRVCDSAMRWCPEEVDDHGGGQAYLGGRAHFCVDIGKVVYDGDLVKSMSSKAVSCIYRCNLCP